MSLLRRFSSANRSLNQWNFSTTRSHDMGWSRPPSYPMCSLTRVRPSLVGTVMRAQSSCGKRAVNWSSGRTSTRATGCLRVGRLDARCVQLVRTDLAVEQRRGDEVFEVVVALFFQPGMILGAVISAAGKILAGLEDVTTYMLDVCGIEFVAA